MTPIRTVGLLTVLCIGILLILASATRQPVQIKTTFDPLEHNVYTQPGESSIKGQGFLRQQGGGVVTCAGSEVLLMPVTSYFREVVMHFRAGNTPQIAKNIDQIAARKRGQCDAQGNFSFSQLPAGSWFVMTQVNWVVSSNEQGGRLIREVYLSKNETIQVLLTEKDFVGR